jgi:hypothetical protein
VPGIPFTPENARAMQAKGQAAKLARVEELRATVEAMRQPTEDFREDLTKAVRSQMRIVSERIDRELDRLTLDHKALGALAATLSTFEAIEQKLSMRAGPGNLKPSAPRKARAGSFQPPPPADDDGSAG